MESIEVTATFVRKPASGTYPSLDAGLDKEADSKAASILGEAPADDAEASAPPAEPAGPAEASGTAPDDEVVGTAVDEAGPETGADEKPPADEEEESVAPSASEGGASN